MQRLRRAFVRTLIPLSLITVFVAVPGDTVDAQVPAECDVFDTQGVSVVSDPVTGTATWTINGNGHCSGGSLSENFQVNIKGTGTSSSLGLCSSELPLTNLKLLVTATFTNSNTTITQSQIWTIPLAVQPSTVPVTIGGQTTGAGIASTRLFLKCPDAGTDAARFIWAQTL